MRSLENRVVARTAPLVCALTFLAFCASSFAYKASGERWTRNRHVVMYLSLGGPTFLQDGFTSFDQSAADALNIWNGYLAHMQFVPMQSATLPAMGDDYNNSAFFSSTVYGQAFGKNVLAVTLTSTRASIIIETDVLFNSAISWDSYRGPRQELIDFHRVALHEFGHVLGLNHPDDAGQKVTAIMNSIISSVDGLQSDDITGAQSIYNTGPAYLDSNPSGNLVNLSTRAFVDTGDKVLIGGIIIQGSQPATVVLRAVGHSLAARNIANALFDPVMELRNANGTLIAQNDDWIDGNDAETIASYKLDPANSIESALLSTLSAGSYTAIVKSFDNADGILTGTALVELYDLHTTGGRAANISTRGQVLGGDDAMIAGFIVGGNQAKEVVVRGLGPSLAAANVPGALSDPTIEIRNSAGQLVKGNDNWQSDSVSAARLQTLNLAPKQPVESALDIILSPGAYTVLMRGVNGATGIGLVEVYDLSPAP